MEISNKQIMEQASHLLDTVEEDSQDPAIKKTIDDLRIEIRGLLFLDKTGSLVAFEVGKRMLFRQLDELILDLAVRPTVLPTK